MVWIWLVITLLVNMATVIMPVSAGTPQTELFAPIIRDTNLTPGETFYIDINIAYVEKMWGYNFFVWYNTTVLTATGYSSYDPFTYWWPSGINDTAGWVFVAYSIELGEEVELSTVEPKPIARIDFTVDALGTSMLDLHGSELPNIEAAPISHDVYDGFFANIEIKMHDIAVTDVTAPAEVTGGDSVSIGVTVANEGDFDETFNVSTYYDGNLIGTETDVSLTVGENKTISFTWHTTDIAKGTYIIMAKVLPVPEEIDTRDNKFIDEVTITADEEQAPDFVLYAVVGIAVVIVAAVTSVYLLRIRKTKPT